MRSGRTGFLFSQPSIESFLGAICRAFATFGSKRQFNAMRTDAMANTFGWNKSVQTYLGVYRGLTSHA